MTTIYGDGFVADRTSELPPLPNPAYGWYCDYYDGWTYTENPQDRWSELHLYSEEQMQVYARLAVEQERERCAKVCESIGGMGGDYWTDQCAAAIRKS